METYKFEAKLNFYKTLPWYIFTIFGITIIFGVIGYLLAQGSGAYIGGIYGFIGASVFCFLVYCKVKASGVVIEVTDDGISLSYHSINKYLEWEHIKRVTRTRSILSSNLIRLEGNDQTMIINLKLQPRWKELIELLQEKVPAHAISNF